MSDPVLTVLQVVGAVGDALDGAGYRRVQQRHDAGNSTSGFRVYEDEFGVIGLRVFESPSLLMEGWADAQTQLVSVIGSYIGREEDKAWDGYLVLLTPIPTTPAELDAMNGIRYDTTRVRKIVATGDELRSIADVSRVLQPLLPLESASGLEGTRTGLELLPDLLAEQGVDPSLTRRVIDAFNRQEPMIRVIHDELKAK